MKKVFIIIIVIATALFFYTMRDSTPLEKTVVPTENESEVFRPDPSSATFNIDDEVVILSAGRNEKPITPGSKLMEETVLLEQFAYGDINSDDKEDTVLLLSRNGVGSGTFIYLAAYVSGPVTYKGSKAIFIGDRIIPQSISINQGIVTINYLDRKIEDSFNTAPSIPITKLFVFRNGEFQER